MSSSTPDAVAEREVPLIRAEDYKKDMKSWNHGLSPDTTKLTGAFLAKSVGMKGYGVNYLQLEPNTESCTPHYHLQESEWIYILKGSATLHIIDASLANWSRRNLSPQTTKVSELQVKDYEMKEGDFVGFQAGVHAAKFAHGLRGGPEGCEFLCGGDDAKLDTCIYPTIGVARIYEADGDGPGRDAYAHLPQFDEVRPPKLPTLVDPNASTQPSTDVKSQ